MNKDPNNIQYQKARPGLFYGYIIAILCFCIFVVIYGLRFSYGVFFEPMSSELGWSSALTSLVYSSSMILEGIFNIILGRMIDKYGPRLVVGISGILIAAGYCLIPLAGSPWQFFLFYGGLVGIGMGGIFGPLVTLIPRWFIARRNLMTGMVISSVGVGILIISPLANQLILKFGWRMTFFIFGIVILLVTTICAQFLRRDPYTMGLVAHGERATNRNEPIQVQGLSLKEAMRTYQFWSAFMILLAYGFCANSVNVHIVPYAIKLGISATIGASIIATMGGLQIAGRIGLGLAADKVGNKRIFLFGFTAFTLLLFWLPTISLTWAFFAFAVIFGLAQGGMASSQSPMVAGLFGVKSLGLLFGCCGFGFTLGAALGPFATGNIYDLTGSYNLAFLPAAIISIISLFVTLGLKPIKSRYISRDAN
jgi:MFS transporter, OFA family, oxalate/formate antiporter